MADYVTLSQAVEWAMFRSDGEEHRALASFGTADRKEFELWAACDFTEPHLPLDVASDLLLDRIGAGDVQAAGTFVFPPPAVLDDDLPKGVLFVLQRLRKGGITPEMITRRLETEKKDEPRPPFALEIGEGNPNFPTLMDALCALKMYEDENAPISQPSTREINLKGVWLASKEMSNWGGGSHTRPSVAIRWCDDQAEPIITDHGNISDVGVAAFVTDVRICRGDLEAAFSPRSRPPMKGDWAAIRVYLSERGRRGPVGSRTGDKQAHENAMAAATAFMLERDPKAAALVIKEATARGQKDATRKSVERLIRTVRAELAPIRKRARARLQDKLKRFRYI